MQGRIVITHDKQSQQGGLQRPRRQPSPEWHVAQKHGYGFCQNQSGNHEGCEYSNETPLDRLLRSPDWPASPAEHKQRSISHG